MRKAKAPPRSQINSIRHKDRRVNIPTEELRDFVAGEERSPKRMLYPRDLSLDPQLVWKGKDEQDARDLAVDIVPIYIQEKIHPHAIIEDIRAQAAAGRVEAQPSLFAEFNGIPFEQQVEFYQHEQNWANRMILGDSLLVMTSLAEKEGLKGKVQMIYLDPPYGIKFGSNWQVSTRKRDVKDGKAEDLTRQPEQIRAFRDTWELGLHSYLAYLRDRLAVARELLTESGSFFVQISDASVHLVRSVLDETLGAQNFVAMITFTTTTGQTSEFLANPADYLLWYAKDLERVKFRRLYSEKVQDASEDQDEAYRSADLTSQRQNRPSGPGSAMYFPVTFDGRTFVPAGNRGWTTTAEGIERLRKADRLFTAAGLLRLKRYPADFPYRKVDSLWDDTSSAALRDKVYIVQTNAKVIERCLLMTTDPGDLVLDPTCGSGTTAYVAEQWGRRWITIDTSRVALALARTRLMAAKYSYYLLADSQEGIQKEAQISGIPPSPSAKPHNDVKKGFVYKRVPHITLKSIANNEEIDSIHARFQEQLEPLRARLNQLLGQKGEEWEIPRQPGEEWPAEAVRVLEDWWRLRRERQKEIDASIARRGETEFLCNDPYEDPKRIRVSGPFTVESLSPHRVLSVDQERPATEVEGEKSDTAGQFVNVILDNLRQAGVENRIKTTSG
jgi:adenine-specific DNA-methyltransferase